MDPFNKLSPLHLKVGRLFAKEKEKISADKSTDYLTASQQHCDLCLCIDSIGRLVAISKCEGS